MKWAALALAACATGAGGHVGPITATVVVDGRTFACSQGGVCEHTGDAVRLVAEPGFRLFALAALGARGEVPARLLVGGGTPARSGEVALLDLDGRQLAHARVADDLVYGVALAPVLSLAAAACADGHVLLLALPELTRVAAPWRHDGPAVAVAFAPDGELLASAGHDGKLLLGAPVAPAGANGQPCALLDHTAAVTCLAWSADGQRLASGAKDGKVRLHDRAGRLLHTWSRLGGAVAAVDVRAHGVMCTIHAAPGTGPRTALLEPN